MANIYSRFGVRTWINAAGYFTRLGGNLMPDEVLDAMREASASFVDITELQAAASTVIAKHTGAEAGIVTSSASAAMTLGAAACLTGLDSRKMEQLPNTEGMADEIIMHRSHRCSYDHAIRAAGAKIKEFGLNDRVIKAGIRGIEAWETEAAITDQSAAFFFMMSNNNEEDLKVFIDTANRHSIPVIVDAAPWLPPIQNLRKFIDMGASLVTFSGGKAIRGPQGTGILCGKRDLVAAALLQQIDMNVIAESWNPPAGLIPCERLTGIPHQGIGRGMKIGKEDIIGLLVALERFVEFDHEKEFASLEAILFKIKLSLDELPHIRTKLVTASETGRRPNLEIHIDKTGLGLTAIEVSNLLQSGSPPIHMTERYSNGSILVIDPAGLKESDIDPITSALRTITTSKNST